MSTANGSTPAAPHTPIPAGRLRVLAVLAFLGFFAIGAGWAVAMPWDGGPDEQSHITRAAGVVSGDVAPEPIYHPIKGLSYPLAGTYQNIPAGVARPSPPCFAFKPDTSADCVKPRSVDPDQPVRKFSAGAGRYMPTYYAVVGWPLKWWPNETGLLLARLISAALSAAFLAAATYSVLAWSKRPFLLAGVLVATTPMTLSLAGVLNPNGLEITAAIALWTALVPLVLGHAPPDRRLLILVGVSAVVVAWARPSGPLCVAMAMTILVATAGRTRVRTLLRDRGAWTVGIVAVLACGVSAVWTLAMKSTELIPVQGGRGLAPFEALRVVVVNRVPFYLQSMVGQFGWVDVVMPNAYYAVWYAVTGFLVITALAVGRNIDRTRLILVVAGAFALPLQMDIMGAEEDGMMAQGRYILPIAVGAAVVAAYTVDERRPFTWSFLRSATGWLVVMTASAHVVGLAYTMIRYQHGLYADIPAVNPLTGDWQPPIGSGTALVTAVLGAVLLVVMVRTAMASSQGAAEPKGLEGQQEHPDRSDVAEVAT